MTLSKPKSDSSLNGQTGEIATSNKLGSADHIILSNLQGELLRDKQIIILDKNQKKNEQFLKAIQDVMREFSKMYEIPREEQEAKTTPDATLKDETADEGDDSGEGIPDKDSSLADDDTNGNRIGKGHVN